MVMIENLARLINRVYPLWLSRPLTIQIDTQNYCNLKCVYCNVRENFGFNLPRGRMTDEMLEGIIKYWGQKVIWAIAPFMDGEPLLETRLPKINYWIKKYTNAICIIDTNGSIWKNRHFLLHPNMKIVRFTISACDPETYKVVHGKDLFSDAVKTFQWFRCMKNPKQKLMLHFIINKFNDHQIEKYIKLFKGVKIRFFALHYGPGQSASKMARGESLYHFPYIVEANGKRHFEILPNLPCQCWDIMAIGVNGEIMQCPDYPASYNYGNVKDVDMMEAWRERLKNKMDNSYCRECNVKVPNWKQIIDKYIK